MQDIGKIRDLLAECRQAAREAGWDGADTDYEYTAADLSWVTDQLGYQPSREEWEAAGLGWVGGAHCGPESLTEVQADAPEQCAEAYRAACGEIDADCEAAHDGPVTLEALAYAYARRHHRTLQHMIERASQEVRERAIALMPEPEGPVEVDLGGGWVASTARAESSRGQPVYVAESCEHGEDVAHSLSEALDCGLLRDVREARGLTQEEVAEQLGAEQATLSRWESGSRTPGRFASRALRDWLLGE